MDKQLKRSLWIRREMRKKRKYNKSEFVNIVCNNCELCRNVGNPTFCYNVIYKKHKQKFIQKIFPKLLRLRNKQEVSGVLFCFCNPETFRSEFEQTFLKDKLVKYKDIFEYLELFRLQLTDFNNVKDTLKRDKYIVKAYPTFFANNWQKEISEILSK